MSAPLLRARPADPVIQPGHCGPEPWAFPLARLGTAGQPLTQGAERAVRPPAEARRGESRVKLPGYTVGLELLRVLVAFCS